MNKIIIEYHRKKQCYVITRHWHTKNHTGSFTGQKIFPIDGFFVVSEEFSEKPRKVFESRNEVTHYLQNTYKVPIEWHK